MPSPGLSDDSFLSYPAPNSSSKIGIDSSMRSEVPYYIGEQGQCDIPLSGKEAKR